jgi:hypothetical protein
VGTLMSKYIRRGTRANDKRKGHKLGKYKCAGCEKEIVARLVDWDWNRTTGSGEAERPARVYQVVRPACLECLPTLDRLRASEGHGPYPWRQVAVSEATFVTLELQLI